MGEAAEAAEAEATTGSLLPESGGAGGQADHRATPEQATTNEQGEQVAADGTVIGPRETPEPQGERPDWLPEKFKSPEDLAKSYTELERKLGERANPAPETYELKYDGETAELTDEDVAFFKEHRLSNDQAQAMLDYTVEQVLPELHKAALEVETTKLATAWNMEADNVVFKERLGKLAEWGAQNLPAEAVESLRSSAEGVKAMWAMMQSQGSSNMQSSAPTRTSKAELHDMVKDPRYHSDEGFRARVEAEFQKAFDK